MASGASRRSGRPVVALETRGHFRQLHARGERYFRHLTVAGGAFDFLVDMDLVVELDVRRWEFEWRRNALRSRVEPGMAIFARRGWIHLLAPLRPLNVVTLLALGMFR